MSLPMRLSLLEKDNLGIEPAGDIASLRYDKKQIRSMEIKANKEHVLKGIEGKSMEINAVVDPAISSKVGNTTSAGTLKIQSACSSMTKMSKSPLSPLKAAVTLLAEGATNLNAYSGPVSFQGEQL